MIEALFPPAYSLTALQKSVRKQQSLFITGLAVLPVMTFSAAAVMTVIAADTVVYDPPSAPGAYGEIMGKPQDENDAFRMLMSLRGRTHQVITGVCLIRPEKHIKRCFYDVTYVTFCNYPEEEIRDYLKTPEAYDKAGAYAIQETFGKYAVDVRGSELNVIGFPWEKYCELTETMF